MRKGWMKPFLNSMVLEYVVNASSMCSFYFPCLNNEAR